MRGGESEKKAEPEKTLLHSLLSLWQSGKKRCFSAISNCYGSNVQCMLLPGRRRLNTYVDLKIKMKALTPQFRANTCRTTLTNIRHVLSFQTAMLEMDSIDRDRANVLITPSNAATDNHHHHHHYYHHQIPRTTTMFHEMMSLKH